MFLYCETNSEDKKGIRITRCLQSTIIFKYYLSNDVFAPYSHRNQNNYKSERTLVNFFQSKLQNNAATLARCNTTLLKCDRGFEKSNLKQNDV